MYTPYWYQQDSIDAALSAFENGFRHILIVAPTGSGKSVIAACFCQQLIAQWDVKILLISSFTEILKQDHAALRKQMPHQNIGLYSAKCGSKTIDKITVAGIQSVYRKPQLFADFDLIIVDEAHLISFDQNTIYRKFLDALDKPTLGLTATPFRMMGGYLHQGPNAYFQHVAYEITIPVLQKEGKLCEVVNQGSKVVLDASKIKVSGGDYVRRELSREFDRDAVTEEIVGDLTQHRDLFDTWLGFAIDIQHAKNLTQGLQSKNISAEALHSGLAERVQRALIQAYREGEFQALVSVDMVAIGFDVPRINLLFLARHTKSVSRHIQMIGRGMRVFPGKTHLLVLDYARNTKENGPIDNPRVPEPKQRKRKGDPLVKECPECFLFVTPSIRICPRCDFEFPIKHKLSASASDAPIISKGKWYPVDGVSYAVKKAKKSGISMLWVRYSSGLRGFSEYVLFEHSGYALAKAHKWWEKRFKRQEAPSYTINSKTFVPPTSKKACDFQKYLKKPVEIYVDESGKYPQIKDYLFKE